MRKVSKSFSKRFGKRVSYPPDSFPGLVDKATDVMLFKLDWGLVTAVCDKSQNTTDKEMLRLGVRAARKKIQDEQHKVVMFGLQVIDALVKNNSQNFFFLQFMAEQKMMNSLVRLVDRGIDKGGRDNLEAMEKVLDMLQAWGEGYHKHQDKGLRLFVETYHKLRERNVKFPRPLANQSVNIFTPKSRVQQPQLPQQNFVHPPAPVLEAPPQRHPQDNLNNPHGLSDLEIAIQLSQQQAQQNELQPAQQQLQQQQTQAQTVIPLPQWLETVANTIALLEQSLNAAESKEEIQSSEIIKDLVEHLEASQKELMGRLQSNVNEADMHKLLHMNDSIHHVKDLYAIMSVQGSQKKPNEAKLKSTYVGGDDDSLVSLADLATLTQNAPPSPALKSSGSKKQMSKKEGLEIQRQSTHDDLLDLFSGTAETTNDNSDTKMFNNLGGLMPMSTLPLSNNKESVMPAMNKTQDNGLMSNNNGHMNPISNAMGLMPPINNQMMMQQNHMLGKGRDGHQFFNINNNAAMQSSSFGRGQNYLASPSGGSNGSNFMMNKQNGSTTINNSMMFPMQQHPQQQRQNVGNSNPFQMQQQPQQRNRGNSNPFEKVPSTPNNDNIKYTMKTNTPTTPQSATNQKEKFMHFSNGRRVSISNNTGTNNQGKKPESNTSDKSSPFSALGLKQPKQGKRRVRGNSGSKDTSNNANNIFADLNDLALNNPED
jgi:hypothetical protein